MKAIVLIGGGGTRLWPLSTPKKPKQFQKIASDQSMLEETIDRLDFLRDEDIYLALNKEHINLVKDLCPQIPDKNLIIEPALRDTASCIGFAASIIEKTHPNEVIAIIYADHFIKNKKVFQKNLRIAAELSEKEDSINIVEVPATDANTNYGYVKLGKKLKTIDDTEIYSLDKFTEKPDEETAKKFVISGKYLWNTGIYVFKAKKILQHYKEIKPETYEKFQHMMKFYGTDHQSRIIHETYPSLEKISLDYAIMEKVDPKEVRLIKAENLGWSDIGNWEAIWEILPQNEHGNSEHGNVTLLDCKDCLVHNNSNKKIATIGLENIVVVNTDEGLLICKKDQSKRVKEIL